MRTKHTTVFHVSPKAYGIDYKRIVRLSVLAVLVAVYIAVRWHS